MNYTVRLSRGILHVSPPIYKSDRDGDPAWEQHPRKDSLVLEEGFPGEVLDIHTKADMVAALYDAYQTSDILQEGDTFILKGESQPFAVCRGVHVIPTQDRAVYGERTTKIETRGPWDEIY